MLRLIRPRSVLLSETRGLGWGTENVRLWGGVGVFERIRAFLLSDISLAIILGDYPGNAVIGIIDVIGLVGLRQI